MRLDADRAGTAERGTGPDVRHRRVLDAADRSGRRVDAGRRQQLVRALQVGRREAELAPARVAMDHRAVDEVMVTEQGAGLVNAPFRNQPPDAGAADDEILVADRVDLLGAQAVAGAEGADPGEVASTAF